MSSARSTGVLVVDDEEAVRSSAAEILRGEGYEVIEAPDGEVALDLLGRHPVSVMVLDIRMPRRDGVSVLEALADPPPVVLMSAYCLDPDTEARLGTKVGAFLKKPFAPLRLIEEVEAVAHGDANAAQNDTSDLHRTRGPSASPNGTEAK